VIALLLAAYVGAEAWATRTVASGVTVLGEDLGGMSPADASVALERIASTVNSTLIDLRIEGYSVPVMPAAAGIAMDADATLNRLTGFTLSPQRLFDHVQGGNAVSPVVRIDAEALTGAVDRAAAILDRDAESAVMTLNGTEVMVDGGQPGIVVDTDATVATVLNQWPRATVLTPVAEVTQPATTRTVAEAFRDDVNSRLLTSVVSLVGPNGTVEIAPDVWAEFATVDTSGDAPELVVDGPGLAAALVEANPALNNEARGSSVIFDASHNLQIDEGQPGREIDASLLGERVVAAAGRALHVDEMPYTITAVVPPAENLNIGDLTTKISAFDTPLTNETIRNKNLQHAADKISGVILVPGATFDLTKVLSPITIEDGYVEAGVLNNGIHTTGVGGGLSQMATTSYNAAYFAGFDLLDHRQHSVWFPRYPAGRESTIYTGQINMVFKNDTPYAAIMNSYIENNRLHVDIWSTPYYRVETEATPHQNVKEPGTTVVISPDCVPSRAGQSGFTITNYRRVFLGDTLVKDESDTWTYKPDNAIACE